METWNRGNVVVENDEDEGGERGHGEKEEGPSEQMDQ